MQPAPRPSFHLLTWLLAAALLVSVGANLYWLMPGYRSERAGSAAPGAARDDEDDEEDEDGDASWVALTEELRETRHRLAACQARPLPPQSVALRQ